MQTSDVPPNPRSSSLLSAAQPNTGSRLTYQDFTFEDPIYDIIAPHNADVKQRDHADWPPHFLFDVSYGSVAMKTWGASEFMNFAENNTKEYHYQDKEYEDNSDNDDSGPAANVRRKGTVRPKKADKHSRPATQQAKAGDGQERDFFDLILGLWEYGGREDLRRARRMEDERIRESVQKWCQNLVA